MSTSCWLYKTVHINLYDNKELIRQAVWNSASLENSWVHDDKWKLTNQSTKQIAAFIGAYILSGFIILYDPVRNIKKL